MSEQFNVQPGTVFAGDFRIVRALSAGGMGAVYAAEQVSTGKPRALKVMLPALVSDPALRKRFEQEARIGSLIESEHVVEVVGAGIDGGTGLPWLAMELLQGEDLDKLVSTRGALPIPDVLVLFEQLCHAVGAAHRVGVVHRDLKPENIFLAQAHRAGASYMVKVLDFGIAKIVAEASTKQTAAMGSPIWMAPEQADQSPITPSTDVWALGLIAFFLLTGRPFWKSACDDSATIPMVLKEVLFEPIVPASMRTAELGRSLPPGFDAWFARCVARDAHTRFPDATQAGAALAAVLAGGAPASVIGFGPTMPPASAYGASAAMAQFGTGSAALSATGPSPGMQPGSGPVGMASAPAMTAPAPGTAGGYQAGVQATGPAGSFTISGPAGQATPAPAPKVPASVGAALVIAAIAFGGLVAGGIWYAHKQTTAAAPVAPAGDVAQSSPDMPTVLEAKRLVDEGKFDLAHQRLSQVPAGSDARQSTQFKDVEFKWASETLLLADRTTDLSGKRALLQAVAGCPTVDDTVRSSARDRLAALDAPKQVDGGVTNANLSLAALHGRRPSSARGASTELPTSPAVAPPAPTTQPDPTPAPAPPVRSIYDLVNSGAPADWWTARRTLEPKMTAGTATVDEIHLLSQVCKNQKDKACQKSCARALSARR